MPDHRHVVAIDGPAAAGKSTVARLLAERLGAMLFDTGTLYRALTLAAQRNGIGADDAPRLAELANQSHLDILPPSQGDGRLYDVLLDGEDVTWPIRDPEVEASVSQVAAHQAVRAALLPVQRRIATGKVVIVGRDIGSTVVPDAGVKVFLQASVEERARRRFLELEQRGQPAEYDTVLCDLRMRDEIDSSRSASPLRVPDGALVLDTDGLSVDEVVAALEARVHEAWEPAPAGSSSVP